MQTTGGWQFNFGGGSGSSKDKQKEHHLHNYCFSSSNLRGRSIKVVILGQTGVGKTAIAVRFASGRFIGEYDSSTERVYRVPTTRAAAELSRTRDCWEVLDSPATCQSPVISESRMRWADAVLLVYSVTDRVSFEETWHQRFLLNQAKSTASHGGKRSLHLIQFQGAVQGTSCGSSGPIVLLVGNKTDLGADDDALQGDRMVSTAEGRKRARDIDAHAFHEISARESYDQVMAVFVNVARLMLLQQTREEPVQQSSFGVSSTFRLRASTDGSIDARRRSNFQQPITKRRFSISARGAPH